LAIDDVTLTWQDPTPVITVTNPIPPAALAFGNQIYGTTPADKTVTISGTNITPAGITAISNSTAYTISNAAGGPFASTTTIAAAGGTLYVRFATPNTTGTKNTTISFSGVNSSATQATASINVTGATLQPTVTVTGTPLATFTSTLPSPSTNKTLTVSGSNIASTIIVGAPANFELSLNPAGPFTQRVTINAISNAVTNVPVYERYNPGVAGAHSGSDTVITAGASNQLIAVFGTSIEAEPTLQPANLLLSNFNANDITVDVNGGDGANTLVVASLNPIAGVPADATNPNYTASTTFGNGSTLNTGEFVVFNGPTGANSFVVSNLASNTPYYFAAFSYNGTAATANYLTTSPATAPVAGSPQRAATSVYYQHTIALALVPYSSAQYLLT
jgi:hypothetical protein